MKISLWVADTETGEVLEDLGMCVCDNPGRAVQMYDQDEKWIEKGFAADVLWKDITNPSAAALGSIRTPKKSASSRENGKKGGRPKKN